MTRTITIASGKGGVGKTNISVNLALHLATLGYRTCLFDADLGLANVNILLGLSPGYNLEDVIFDRHSLQDIIVRNYQGVDIIPGSSGVEKMANLDSDQVEHLIRSFSELDRYDFLLFDTSAGVSRNVIAFCLASSEVVLIITPEPTSLTDGYALLKILSLNGFNGTVKVVVNECKTTNIAKLAYDKLKETVRRYLRIDIMPLGVVVQDHKVVEAIKAQQALILLYPESIASKCIKYIAKKLLEHRPEGLETFGMISFWTKCLQLIRSPLKFTSPKEGGKETEPKPSTGNLYKRAPQLARETKLESVPEESRDAEPSEAGSIAHLESDISPLMSKLIDSVSSVSQELQLIRKAIEDGGRNGLRMSGRADEGQKALQHKPITLDFEAFQKQHGINVNKEGNE